MTLRASALLLFAVACSSPRQERPPPPGPDTSLVDPGAAADLLFEQRCTPCHGPTGAGDGAASAALNPRPPSFHDPAWQKSVPDEYIEKIVTHGGQSVGKSASMPPNPDLAGKQAIVAALRNKVRGFGRR